MPGCSSAVSAHPGHRDRAVHFRQCRPQSAAVLGNDGNHDFIKVKKGLVAGIMANVKSRWTCSSSPGPVGAALYRWGHRAMNARRSSNSGGTAARCRAAARLETRAAD